MINHKYKCIFIHIPKCGGSSIENAIDGRDWWHINKPINIKCEKHFSAEKCKQQYSKYWEEYTKFTMVRNPYSLQVSWYFFKNIYNHKMSFKEYVKNEKINRISRYSGKFLDKKWNKIMPDLLTSYEYISTNGAIELDFIGKIENLQEDFDIICDKIGIPHQQLPHKNKTKHKHYTEYYDDETKQMVAERYAKDIEYFGYEFD
jgi:hypothetical protein